MLQRLIAVYQQIASRARNTHAGRRSVSLHVVALETRTTPAVAPNFLPMMQPPEMVVISPPQTVVPSATAASCVRADLFGVGEVAKPEHANEWEEFLADDHVAAAEAAPAPRQESVAAEGDGEGAAIIEGETFLPYVD